MSKFLDAAYVILLDAGKPLHADEIARAALEEGKIESKGSTPARTMSSMLSTDIKDKGGRSRFAKGGPGLFKINDSGQGVGRPPNPDGGQGAGAAGPGMRHAGARDKPYDKYHQARIGAAGEFRVMSELLLHGYNADHITIDRGIDIRATKGGNTYEIQVKTVTAWKDKTGQKGKKFIITIRKEAFDSASSPNVYYIFVLRDRDNDIKCVTVPNKEMKRMIADKTITKNKAGYQVRFAAKGGSLFLHERNVDRMVDDWDL